MLTMNAGVQAFVRSGNVPPQLQALPAPKASALLPQEAPNEFHTPVPQSAVLDCPWHCLLLIPGRALQKLSLQL